MDRRAFVPAPAQGVLGLQIRIADEELNTILQKLNHEEVKECIDVERELLKKLEGGCQLPLGAYCIFQDGKFRFSIELALAVGVVGGVTAAHPLAKLAMQILDNPSAKELMMYLAVAGLASNFGAVKALVSVARSL